MSSKGLDNGFLLAVGNGKTMEKEQVHKCDNRKETLSLELHMSDWSKAVKSPSSSGSHQQKPWNHPNLLKPPVGQNFINKLHLRSTCLVVEQNEFEMCMLWKKLGVSLFW